MDRGDRGERGERGERGQRGERGEGMGIEFFREYGGRGNPRFEEIDDEGLEDEES